MKKHLREYLTFSRKERMAIIILTLVCLLLILLPFWIEKQPWPTLREPSEAEVAVLLNSVEMTTEAPDVTTTKLFPFNPNTITLDEWKLLGVEEKIAQRIVNYRNKGGRFREPADLKKIWGMPEARAEALMRYVRLPAPVSFQKWKSQTIPVIDINMADTTGWKSLPGIGTVLAKRIVRQRERSGGFARWEELQSVMGLTDSMIQQIRPYLKLQPEYISKQSLNRASAYELENKTGLPPATCKAIVQWRQIHGSYQVINDLLQVPGVTPETILLIQQAFVIQ